MVCTGVEVIDMTMQCLDIDVVVSGSQEERQVHRHGVH